jgi:hypothetical protein
MDGLYEFFLAIFVTVIGGFVMFGVIAVVTMTLMSGPRQPRAASHHVDHAEDPLEALGRVIAQEAEWIAREEKHRIDGTLWLERLVRFATTTSIEGDRHAEVERVLRCQLSDALDSLGLAVPHATDSDSSDFAPTTVAARSLSEGRQTRDQTGDDGALPKFLNGLIANVILTETDLFASAGREYRGEQASLGPAVAGFDGDIRTSFVPVNGESSIDGSQPPSTALRFMAGFKWDADVRLGAVLDVNFLAPLLAAEQSFTPPQSSAASDRAQLSVASSVAGGSNPSTRLWNQREQPHFHGGTRGRTGPFRRPPTRGGTSPLSSDVPLPPKPSVHSVPSAIPRNLLSMHVDVVISRVSVSVDLHVLFHDGVVKVAIQDRSFKAVVACALGGRDRIDVSRKFSNALHRAVARETEKLLWPACSFEMAVKQPPSAASPVVSFSRQTNRCAFEIPVGSGRSSEGFRSVGASETPSQHVLPRASRPDA